MYNIINYLFSFYIGVIFLPPYKNESNFNAVECVSNPCYLSIQFLLSWDLTTHNALPTLIIAIFSLALLYHIISHKKRLRQPIQWQRYRRMSM